MEPAWTGSAAKYQWRISALATCGWFPCRLLGTRRHCWSENAVQSAPVRLACTEQPSPPGRRSRPFAAAEMCLVLVGEKERNDNASDIESSGGTRLGTYEELKWVKKSNETKENNIKQHLQQKKEVHCGGEGKVSSLTVTSLITYPELALMLTVDSIGLNTMRGYLPLTNAICHWRKFRLEYVVLWNQSSLQHIVTHLIMTFLTKMMLKLWFNDLYDLIALEMCSLLSK